MSDGSQTPAPGDAASTEPPPAPRDQREHIERHANGSLRARGPMIGDAPHGYWEWFRLDGTMMRSGHFDHGTQVGEWITYDRSGQPYKTTRLPGAAGDQRRPRG